MFVKKSYPQPVEKPTTPKTEKYLALTADTSAWHPSLPLLFLGEWCKTELNRDALATRAHETLPYHWDDRAGLARDFLSVDELYERVLLSFSRALNEFHCVDRPVRFWRIFLGQWLFYFLGVLKDRYETILRAESLGESLLTGIVDWKDSDLVPYDFSEFEKAIVSDAYNHFLFSAILRFRGKIKLEPVSLPVPKRFFSTGRPTKQKVAKVISQMRGREVAFVTSGFSLKNLARLQLSLGQLPLPDWFASHSVRMPCDDGVRARLGESWVRASVGNFDKDDFERVATRLLVSQCPTVYIEGFAALGEEISPGNQVPSIIVSGSDHVARDSVKRWIAECVEKGSALYVAQHGGNYGTSGFCALERHEISISDRFYSWGWKDASKDWVSPMPAGKLLPAARGVRSNPRGKLLLVSNGFPRYFYRFFSAPIAGQCRDFIDDSLRFALALSSEARKSLEVRLYPHDYGWGERQAWRDQCPEVSLRSGVPFLEHLGASRLFIGNHNTTTFLETFVANFPSLVFWRPAHWEIRREAQPMFDRLAEAGIFHTTPESVAAKVNEIWESPLEWWSTERVQATREEFCERYGYTQEDWCRIWKAALTKRSVLANLEGVNES